jgi:hypothetical protein
MRRTHAIALTVACATGTRWFHQIAPRMARPERRTDNSAFNGILMAKGMLDIEGIRASA